MLLKCDLQSLHIAVIYYRDLASGKSGMEIMLNLLTPTTHEWTNSDKLLSALKPPLMRLCARYILSIEISAYYYKPSSFLSNFFHSCATRNRRIETH